MSAADSAAAVVRAAIRADVPVIMWGPPGCGKTAVVRAMAAEDGAHLETVIASQMAPEDVGGIPYVVPASGDCSLSAPPWARRLRAALDKGRDAWLFLDELSCARPDVQASLLRVIQERRVADLDLHGVRIVAAANRADYAASGGDIPAPTANRFAHASVESLSPSAWATGILSGVWPTPPNLERPSSAILAASKASLAGFIQKHAQRLLSPPEPGSESASGAWPSPRSWENACAVLAYVGGTSATYARAAIASCVGDAPASEWETWRDAMDLPDPEELLAGREKLPERADRQAAALASLVAAALVKRPDRTHRVHSAWRIVGKCRPDAALLPGKSLLAGAPECEDAPEARALGGRLLGVK